MRTKILGLALCGAIALVLPASADVISINFLMSNTTNYPQQYLDAATPAGIYARTNWNNVTESPTNSVAGTVNALTNDLGAATGASVTWIASNPWLDWNANSDASLGVGDAQVTLGYLDDGVTSTAGGVTNGVDITVTNIPYGSYSVVLYMSTDTPGGTYQPAAINGGSYSTTGDKYRYFNPNWMDYNTIVATGLTGTLNITLPVRDGATRASVAGLQIAESTEGAPPAEPALDPEWPEDPVDGGGVLVDKPYSGSLAGKAIDRNQDPITYSLVGPVTWLNVATDGTLSGTPSVAYLGTNTFTVLADAGAGGSSQAGLTIVVSEPEGTRKISIDFNNTTNPSWIVSGAQAAGPLESINWNTTSSGSGGPQALIDDLGDASTATITWTSSGTWTQGDNQGTYDKRVAHAYLDDGGSGVFVTVDNIPYAQYRVYGLVASNQDDTYEMLNFQVNGISVLSGSSSAPAYGNIRNMPAGVGPWVDIADGTVTGNYWMVETSGSTLTIDGESRSGDARGSITAIIIENTEQPIGDAVTVAIAGPVAAGTEMVLSWTAQAGYGYTVQTNSNLVVANWGDVDTDVAGIDGTVSYTNAIGSEGQIFYRVITE